MPRQPRKVNPRRTYVVADTAKQTPLTPAFYHPELARACLRELSKGRSRGHLGSCDRDETAAMAQAQPSPAPRLHAPVHA